MSAAALALVNQEMTLTSPDRQPKSPRRRGGRRRARWVEDAEYGAMLIRMVDAYGRRLAMADAGDLPQLVELATKVDDVLAASVLAMRARGVTWSEIGEAFGITKQAAQKRWGHR